MKYSHYYHCEHCPKRYQVSYSLGDAVRFPVLVEQMIAEVELEVACHRVMCLESEMEAKLGEWGYL